MNEETAVSQGSNSHYGAGHWNTTHLDSLDSGDDIAPCRTLVALGVRRC